MFIEFVMFLLTLNAKTNAFFKKYFIPKELASDVVYRFSVGFAMNPLCRMCKLAQFKN